jgi:hypothetical protein
VLDEVGELAVGQFVPVCLAGGAEDAVEGVGVGFSISRNAVWRAGPMFSVRSRTCAQRWPSGIGESVVLSEGGVFVVAAGLLEGSVKLFGADIADPFEETSA